MNSDKYLLLFILLFFVLYPASGQVTIGSAYPPKAGAILDLKENNKLGQNSKKGLQMSRVALMSKHSLAPCTSLDDENEKTLHVGLMLFNTATRGGLCPGLHVWDGEEWIPLSGVRSQEGNVIVEGDKESNSFLIKPGQGIEIPITKAYDMWNDVFENNSDFLSKKEEDIAAKIVWQDINGLFTEPEIIWDESNPENSKILLTSPCEPHSGNASVSVEVEGVVRWSWHVWVTDYDAEATAENFNSDIWMSRNIGATSETPGDLNSLGLYYQWGRKDPFPGAENFIDEAENDQSVYRLKTLYDVASSPVDILKKLPESDEVSMIKKAVTTPTTFYYLEGSQDTYALVWYTNKNVSAISYKRDLWGGNPDGNANTVTYPAKKTAYDPCPKGWRLPLMEAWNTYLWQNLNTVDKINNATKWIEANGKKVGVSLDAGSEGKLSYLPFSGSYSYGSSLKNVQNEVGIWSGTSNNTGNTTGSYGFSMYIRKTDGLLSDNKNSFSNGKYGLMPAQALNVRCVKE